MVRHYKPRPGHRQYRKYDPEVMKKAFIEFAKGHDSIANIARKFNISKSCFHRRLQSGRINSMGGQTAFTMEREEHILKYIHACAPWQYHLQTWDLRVLIKFYLDRRPVIAKRKLDNNLPGQELVMKFLKRHEDTISQRVIQSIQDNGEITAEALLSYFHELRMIITDVPPENIVCYNDVLLTDNSREDDKNLSEVSQNHGIFLMLASSASGDMLPLHVVCEKKQCYERGPRRSVISKQSHQARKRMNQKIFEDWFKTVIVPFYEGKSGKKCLIGGFFSSRISADIIQICNEQNINFVFLPDNSNNLTQPLDSLSHQIYSASSVITHRKKTADTEPTIDKGKIYEVINGLTNIDASEKVKESFKKTGIHPFNPFEVLKLLPDYNETTVHDLDEDFETRCTDIINEVEIKKEVEWSDEYSYDASDDDINVEDKFTKGKRRNSEGMSVSEGNIDLEECDVKLSLADLDLDMCEDATVHMPENMLTLEDIAPRSSRGRKLKPKRKEGYASDESERDIIFYVPAKSGPSKPTKGKNKISATETVSKKRNIEESSTVEDPLLSPRRSSRLQTDESYDELAAESSHCYSAGCRTNTRLLESILASVTRQEGLQERAARAMEAQAQALANIALLLEAQASTR